jgi:hypothetical protein
MSVLLAIDPGNEATAYVRLDTETYKILSYGLMANSDVMNEVVREGEYENVAIEMIASYGMSVGKTVFDTCVWIGRFAQVAEDLGKKAYRVYRQDVKMNLCHSTRAKDTNVRQALIDRFGGQGTSKTPGPLYGITKDKLAALAVGVTWIDGVKIP